MPAESGSEPYSDAKPGRNLVLRNGGTIETLGATATVEVGAGDTFVIETPGGGGFGAAGS